MGSSTICGSEDRENRGVQKLILEATFSTDICGTARWLEDLALYMCTFVRAGVEVPVHVFMGAGEGEKEAVYIEIACLSVLVWCIFTKIERRKPTGKVKKDAEERRLSIVGLIAYVKHSHLHTLFQKFTNYRYKRTEYERIHLPCISLVQSVPSSKTGMNCCSLGCPLFVCRVPHTLVLLFILYIFKKK